MLTPHGIVVKNADVFNSLLKWMYHTKLRELVKWVAVHYGILVTEGYRKKRHRNDLHGENPVRAMDSRSRIYNTGDTTDQEVADDINLHWKYDPKRPHMKCCVFHAVCPNCGERHSPPKVDSCKKCGADISHQWHFHLQVHPNTVFVE